MLVHVSTKIVHYFTAKTLYGSWNVQTTSKYDISLKQQKIFLRDLRNKINVDF